MTLFHVTTRYKVIQFLQETFLIVIINLSCYYGKSISLKQDS